jgi:hypothetical protein
MSFNNNNYLYFGIGDNSPVEEEAIIQNKEI